MKQMNYSFLTVNLTIGALMNCWLVNVLLPDITIFVTLKVWKLLRNIENIPVQ